MKDKELRRYSRVVVDGVEQAPSRAMLRAVGFAEEDFARPQIGIASTWSMIAPCNMHINELAELAAKGADAFGLGPVGSREDLRVFGDVRYLDRFASRGDLANLPHTERKPTKEAVQICPLFTRLL